jgi:hypothetical protein
MMFQSLAQEEYLRMKTPPLHIGIKVHQIGVFGVGFVEGLPPESLTQHPRERAFPRADISRDGDEVFFFNRLLCVLGVSVVQFLSFSLTANS